MPFRCILGDEMCSKESFWSRLLSSNSRAVSPVGVAPAGLRDRKVRGRSTACFPRSIVELESYAIWPNNAVC